MGFFDSLFGGRNIEQSYGFPVVQAQSDFGDTHNQIVQIDFRQLTHFADNDLAHTCVVVPVSNGIHATISHLTNKADPQAYVAALSEVWQEERPPTIPIGGDRSNKHISTSEYFLRTLIQELSEAGFPIVPVSDMLLGGTDLLRNVDLYPYQITVNTVDFAGLLETKDDIPFRT